MQRLDIEPLDRRLKWWLLGVSLSTLLVLLAAALRENFLADWRLIRSDYAEILQEKATDEHGRATIRWKTPKPGAKAAQPPQPGQLQPAPAAAPGGVRGDGTYFVNVQVVDKSRRQVAGSFERSRKPRGTPRGFS